MKGEMSIRPYHDEDWPAVCAVHDAARPDELAGSVAPPAFPPLEEGAGAECFFEAEKLVPPAGDCGGRGVGFVAFQTPFHSWPVVNPPVYRPGIRPRTAP